MRSVVVALALGAMLLIGVASARNVLGPTAPAGPPPSYSGPGDIQAWSSWWGQIAYNNAYATTNKPVGTLTRTDATTCVVPFASTGIPDLTIATPCAGSTTVTSWCSGSTCKWTTYNDQVGTNNLVQATLANAPTLTLTGCAGLSAMPSCTHWTNPSTVMTTVSTTGLQAAPISFLYVGRTTAAGGLVMYPTDMDGHSTNMLDFNGAWYCTLHTNQFGPVSGVTDGNWYVFLNVMNSPGGTCNANTNTIAAVNAGGIADDNIRDGNDNTGAHGWQGDSIAAGYLVGAISGTVTSGNVQATINNIRTTAGF